MPERLPERYREAAGLDPGALAPVEPSRHMLLKQSSCIDVLESGGALTPKEAAMLGWALTFLVIALIAAALGFGGIAGASAGIAKIIFVIFLVLLVGSLVMHLARGRVP